MTASRTTTPKAPALTVRDAASGEVLRTYAQPPTPEQVLRDAYGWYCADHVVDLVLESWRAGAYATLDDALHDARVVLEGIVV